MSSVRGWPISALRVRPDRCGFPRPDFGVLLRRIEEVRGYMRALGADMGEACD